MSKYFRTPFSVATEISEIHSQIGPLSGLGPASRLGLLVGPIELPSADSAVLLCAQRNKKYTSPQTKVRARCDGLKPWNRCSGLAPHQVWAREKRMEAAVLMQSRLYGMLPKLLGTNASRAERCRYFPETSTTLESESNHRLSA